MGMLESIYWASSIAEGIMAAVCCALSFLQAQKLGDFPPFFFMLSGFYACVFMSDAFCILSELVMDYPYVISPGTLSWLGGIVFLITAAMSTVGAWPKKQKQAAKRYRLPALAAPAVCSVFYAFYIVIYPELTVTNILYLIPNAILSFYALYLYLACGNGIQPALRPVCAATLVWIGLLLIHDLFSNLGWDYGYAVPLTVFIWLAALAAPGIYIAARKGAGV